MPKWFKDLAPWMQKVLFILVATALLWGLTVATGGEVTQEDREEAQEQLQDALSDALDSTRKGTPETKPKGTTP